MLVIVSGPSGCGKSTLIHRVRGSLRRLEFAVSHTTRKRRSSEKDGIDYHFVKKNEFERKARAGDFVEFARVHGHLYGTSWAEVRSRRAGAGLILDIDVQGAREVKKKIPTSVMVFIMPPVFEELRKRLELRREDSREDIARRLENARGEILAYDEFDYVVVNHDLEQAAEELRSIIVASRCRMDVKNPRIRRILISFREEPPSKSGKRKRTA
jgi:guanylate kinase